MKSIYASFSGISLQLSVLIIRNWSEIWDTLNNFFFILSKRLSLAILYLMWNLLAKFSFLGPLGPKMS